MINPELFRFLDELKKNNNKEWFDANRSRYKDLRQQFLGFTTLLIAELSQIDPSLKGIEASKTVFRINRDIRFSADKSPYKTNIGAYITSGGRNSFLPGYYLHLEPGQSMVAGGVYMPPSKELKLIREAVFEHMEEFKEIIGEADFVRTFGEIHGEKLKTAPRGFPKDHPDIGLLRYKSYTAFRAVDDEFFFRPDTLAEIMKIFTAMKAFNDFLKEALVNGAE